MEAAATPPTPPDYEALKTLGNEKFGGGHYQEAIKYYTQSIEHTATASAYGNRAFCQLKLENFGQTIMDADKALELDPNYAKAYYRKGSAYVAMNKWKQAKTCFQAVRKMLPKSKANLKKLRFCMKEIKRQAFRKALETEAPKPPSELMNVEQMTVPTSHDGPRMADNMVTRDFVIAMMEHFKNQKRLHWIQVGVILKQMIALLKTIPSLIRAKQGTGAPKKKFTICGDTHGQFYDLMNIFELNGLPSPSNPYLFNGDYVDRGSWSVETCITLFAWKLVYPNSLHLTRGNHETMNMNKMYGFEGEVAAKCKKLMPLFSEAFCWLPLAACLENTVFICHGGLFTKDNVTLDDIEQIKRNREPPDSGLMCDILWSDPCPYPGRHPSKRGCGLSFGPDITKAFLDHNKLKLVVRSHEVKDEGFLVEHGGLLITVFSAPNYCDQMGNKGAMLVFEDDMTQPKFVQYEAVPHPPLKPMAYAPQMGSMFGF